MTFSLHITQKQAYFLSYLRHKAQIRFGYVPVPGLALNFLSLLQHNGFLLTLIFSNAYNTQTFPKKTEDCVRLKPTPKLLIVRSLLLLLFFAPQPSDNADAAPTVTEAEQKEESPILTEHSIKIGGKKFDYNVTAGMMPLKSETGELEANIFYIAYTAKEPKEGSKRPLMFSFNGGPGSASVWLHLGALGPKRVKMLDDGNLPPPPYELVDNPETWLEHTDLVFIDPVGTGFSRAAKPDLGKKFWSLNGDIESIGEFIRLYLTKNTRWTSPLFLVGESYGTTRAAGLSGHLVEKGIALNGIVLVSSVLQFQTLEFDRGNDLAYTLFFPTYTATAFYHKKLSSSLQQNLAKTLKEAEAFAENEYAPALAKGSRLTGKERQNIAAKIAKYTGLSLEFIENNNLRIEQDKFCKELLRDSKKIVGRLDSRIVGTDGEHGAENTQFDPSMTAIRPPYTALLNQYVRSDLKYITDLTYYILGGGIKAPWDWNIRGMGYADTSGSLRSAFQKNPYMKVFVASGYYDLATPYFATEYTLDHLGVEQNIRAGIKTEYYESGHMMYIEVGSLSKLKRDVANFLSDAVRTK